MRGSIRGHEWLCAPPVKRVPSPTWGKNVRVVVPNAVHSGADGTLFVRAAIGFTHQRKLDGKDGLEERSARDRLSQTHCRVGWSLQISRTPLGFELSALFAFSDTTSFGYNLGNYIRKLRTTSYGRSRCDARCELGLTLDVNFRI